jgi:hypothetical protein
MATTLQDIVSNYAKPIDYSPIGQGIESGINNGMKLMQMAQQRRQFGQEMALKQQEFNNTTDQALWKQTTDALSNPNVHQRDALLDGRDQYASKFGKPTLNPDFRDLLHKDDDSRNKFISIASSISPVMAEIDPNTGKQTGKQVVNPNYHQQISQANQLMAADPATGLKLMNEIQGQKIQMAGSELLNQTKTGIAGVQANKGLLGYQDPMHPEDAAAMTNYLAGGPMTPEAQQAFARANAIKSKQIATGSEAKTQQQQSATEKNIAETKAIPQRVGIEAARLHLQQSKDSQDIFNKAYQATSKDRESLKSLNNIDSLLSGGNIPVNQANLAIQVAEKAATGSSRVAAQMINGVKLTYYIANTKKLMAAAGLTDPNQSITDPNIIKNYQNISKAIRAGEIATIRQSAAPMIKSGVDSKLFNTKLGKIYFDTLTDPDKADQLFGGSTAQPAQSGGSYTLGGKQYTADQLKGFVKDDKTRATFERITGQKYSQ